MQDQRRRHFHRGRQQIVRERAGDEPAVIGIDIFLIQRRAEGMRVFRVDRIDKADVLDEAANPPPDAELRDLSEGVFTPAPEHLLAVLRVDPAYAWVADYYLSDSETVEPDGRRRISVRVADPAWVRALALGSAGHVEVLSPEWLAESIRDEALSALAAYSGQ